MGVCRLAPEIETENRFTNYLRQGEASCHNSAVAIAETETNSACSGAIEILHLQVQNCHNFPVEDFLSVGFATHTITDY